MLDILEHLLVFHVPYIASKGSMIFPGTEVRITGLSLPVSSFLPVLKIGVMLSFIQARKCPWLPWLFKCDGEWFDNISPFPQDSGIYPHRLARIFSSIHGAERWARVMSSAQHPPGFTGALCPVWGPKQNWQTRQAQGRPLELWDWNNHPESRVCGAGAGSTWNREWCEVAHSTLCLWGRDQMDGARVFPVKNTPWQEGKRQWHQQNLEKFSIWLEGEKTRIIMHYSRSQRRLWDLWKFSKSGWMKLWASGSEFIPESILLLQVKVWGRSYPYLCQLLCIFGLWPRSWYCFTQGFM